MELNSQLVLKAFIRIQFLKCSGEFLKMAGIYWLHK